ncbi:MAG TPA: NUDIX hydrolase [Dehalococcoidia bacterium]|nr:NUDIX hydrolase [Dehalococcoidia bacterium]
MTHRFCPRCGGDLESRFLEAENHDRLICSGCAYIFYQNPKIVVGTLPIRDGRVLLLRRGIEPRLGAWTFPAGFLELGETVEEAACRETFEECQVRIRLDALLNVYSRPQIGIVNIVYLASILDGTPCVNPEALEFGEFAPDEIPWDELAFTSTTHALEDWIRVLGSGRPPPVISPESRPDG